MYGGILTGKEIHKQVLLHEIEISPFDEKCLNSVSIDLRLGDKFAVYSKNAGWSNEGTVTRLKSQEPLDAADENYTISGTIPHHGMVLRPGILYLMHTVERVYTKFYVPVLDGKSSIGRLGIKVHETAGYGDPGFNGQYTLEVTVVHPVRIYPNMRFCQMRFHTLTGPLELYDGHYKGKTSEGPVPSMSWRQFKEDK